MVGLLVQTWLGAIGALPVLHAQELSTARIARQATPATVTILTFGSLGDSLKQGSGFIVRDDGVIVTNWHMLDGASHARVALASGEVFDRVEYLDGDADADVALLKIPGYGLPKLDVSAVSPEVGSRIVVIGSPEGLSQTVSEGIVSAVRLVEGKQWIQLSAPISSGSSGGPVLDRSGRVVGIATAQLTTGQQLNFAVPIRYAMGLLSPTAVPRKLGEVFGRETDGRSDGLLLLGYAEPAAAVRREVGGAYDVLTWVTWAGGQLLSVGDLVTDWDGDGWLVMWFDTLDMQSSSSEGVVVLVSSHSTSAAGQVALSFGEDSWLEGFQTPDGFYVAGADGSATVEVLASRAAWPGSLCNGMYDIEIESQYVYGDGTVAQNRALLGGEAAVITANDSLYVSISWRNASGGTAGMISAGPLSASGRFRLVVGEGDTVSSLTGTLVSGRLKGEWVEHQGGGARFEGRLSGRRR